MSKDQLRYDRMVEGALRGVVREALREVEAKGLPGDHHFYLTFRTHAPGVDIPEFLRAQYPGEMTIVLQYQFYGLEVAKDGFAVTLSFGGQHERLSIPFAAITTFADPSVSFALQFQPLGGEPLDDMAAEGEEVDAIAEDAGEAAPGTGGTVVALDAFRKK